MAVEELYECCSMFKNSFSESARLFGILQSSVTQPTTSALLAARLCILRAPHTFCFVMMSSCIANNNYLISKNSLCHVDCGLLGCDAIWSSR
jgi:hypothetical protein